MVYKGVALIGQRTFEQNGVTRKLTNGVQKRNGFFFFPVAPENQTVSSKTEGKNLNRKHFLSYQIKHESQ